MKRIVPFLVLVFALPCFAEINLVLLGGPGSGKGTLGKKLADKYHVLHVSTGDIVREQIKLGTPLGLQVKTLVEKGELIPDTEEAIAPLVAILKDTLRAHPEGFVLEGFPRTAFQAAEFEKLMASLGRTLAAVVVIDISDEVIVKRLANRRVCPVCKRSYNLGKYAPKVDGLCDDDGATLFRRDDDVPDVIRHRLEVFHEATAPVEAFYETRKRLLRVDGENFEGGGLSALFEHLGPCDGALVPPSPLFESAN